MDLPAPEEIPQILDQWIRGDDLDSSGITYSGIRYEQETGQIIITAQQDDGYILVVSLLLTQRMRYRVKRPQPRLSLVQED